VRELLNSKINFVFVNSFWLKVQVAGGVEVGWHGEAEGWGLEQLYLGGGETTRRDLVIVEVTRYLQKGLRQDNFMTLVNF
jgi:hypothetical protein